jgi:hypothetical protein
MRKFEKTSLLIETLPNNIFIKEYYYTEGEIKNGQSRETDNIGYTRRGKNKTKTQQNI